MFANRIWIVPTAPAIRHPAELRHMDSEFCWCEPIVETDEDGEGVIHREVTWN